MGTWTICSSLSRYLALEMSLWGSRTDPDHSEIQFSNIRGHETSLVRRFGVCLVPKITGEAQRTVWNWD